MPDGVPGEDVDQGRVGAVDLTAPTIGHPLTIAQGVDPSGRSGDTTTIDVLDLGDDALRAVRRQAGDECRWAQGIDEGQAGSLTGGVDAGDVGDEVVGRFGEHRSGTC